MSLSTEDQKQVLSEAIRQFELVKFQQESLGKAFNATGLPQKAEVCAKEVSQASMAIAHLTEQLEALK